MNAAHGDIQDFALNVLVAFSFYPTQLGELKLPFTNLDIVIRELRAVRLIAAFLLKLREACLLTFRLLGGTKEGI